MKRPRHWHTVCGVVDTAAARSARFVSPAAAPSTKQLPPTIRVQYHVNPTGTVRSYVGAGLNYTLFFDQETTGALAGSNLELDPSFGLAAQAGLDVSISSALFINIEARWLGIDANAKLNGADLGTVELDPWLYGLGWTSFLGNRDEQE